MFQLLKSQVCSHYDDFFPMFYSCLLNELNWDVLISEDCSLILFTDITFI